ncbi:MAG: YgiQ family radical SAM protein, partial [Clostridia bacterium]|nr:YgiQ family radical SAM protein [Clostridia bacterium]
MSFDFVLVSGDAYVDHPSFGAAIIRRLLESRGYSVGLLAQPDWHSAKAFQSLGKPRLAFLVTAGNLDSMVNHYTVSKRRRREDAYSPDGRAGQRPDRASIVYANRCREAYGGTPVVLGGLEASLRRFAHYDYWDDRVRHSLLYDAGADILVYGMGERAMLEVAALLTKGAPPEAFYGVRGVCLRVSSDEGFSDALRLPSFSEVASDKAAYGRAFLMQMREQDAIRGRRLLQAHEKGFLLCNPPAAPLERAELDAVYALPFTGEPADGARVPALEEVRFSIASSRGCFGGCSFCALAFHQGRAVRSRSQASIVDEARRLAARPDFKGYIHDVGGPTANFRQPACKRQLEHGVCADRACIGWEPCKNLEVEETEYASLLKRLRRLPGVKKVFIRSGLRFDYMMRDGDGAFFEELLRHHISGQLKVAPEHVSDRVLRLMNKPPHAVFEA